MGIIVFRTATVADSQRIASLHAESWRSAYRGILSDKYLDGPVNEDRESLWTSRLKSPYADRRYVLLAEADGASVGFVCVLLDEEPEWGAYLDNLHVVPNLKGKGIGRQLFGRAAQWVMSKEPAWPLHLWVFEANDSARRFYDVLNGEVVERRHKKAPDGAVIPSLRYVWRDIRTLLITLTGSSTGLA
jgi:GNAT superfamily N-acetyltransferase